ncbi:hypothetical protein [Specibacter cremeus]|uniref:hypothetical protein n=1 Tax=Specibacter cremeus TaxID=1629051 RepID=UPI000F7ADDD7|nr:hypothetical protein [Specibacter cremeus]
MVAASRKHDLENAVVRLHQGLAALRAAAAAVTVPVTPEMARGVQSTENAWRAMEAEFPFLSAREVGDLLGSTSGNVSSFATDRRRAGTLLGIKRRNAYLYPAFQFNVELRAVRPVVPRLLRMANRLDVPSADLAQWLCAPTGQLDDRRPVDLLDEEDVVVQAAENHYGVQW